jgi:hypothetical protein
MKKKIIFTIAFFTFQLISSQRKDIKMFFGFPNEETNFISGDVIITNLPEINYNRGSFYQKGLIFDQLLTLLQSKKENVFEIKLNRCTIKGNKEYNNNSNENLALSIEHFLKINNVTNGIINKLNFKTCDGNLITNKDNDYYVSSGNHLFIQVK